MKHARRDYDRIQDPSGKIPADEPVFLLRAQDRTASQAVRFWIMLNECLDVDKEHLRQVKHHVSKMETWPLKKIADSPKKTKVSQKQVKLKKNDKPYLSRAWPMYNGRGGSTS